MTPQERELIDGLIQRIRNTQVTNKDTEAEQHLQQGLAGYPDAVYVLAQTVLVQQYGLTQAQQQIQQLQAALDEARQHASQAGGGSFLSKIFGGSSASQQGSGQGYTAAQQSYQPVNNSGYPSAPYAQPGYGTPYAQPVSYAPAGGGFLRGALQTAAGVAAGEMVFQGMEGLFHGFGGGYGEGRPGETVVNNYYDDAGRDEHRAVADDSNFYNPEHDASRDAGDQDSRGFADTGSGDNSQPDDYGVDDSNDSGSDDAGFDNGGGFDDSGFGDDNS